MRKRCEKDQSEKDEKSNKDKKERGESSCEKAQSEQRRNMDNRKMTRKRDEKKRVRVSEKREESNGKERDDVLAHRLHLKGCPELGNTDKERRNGEKREKKGERVTEIRINTIHHLDLLLSQLQPINIALRIVLPYP
jgi:hypothetical protein